ncbi:TPA: hypothetical protein LNF46_003458 [Vibrio cholerae]|nr:hypothetical protein [Vibrio cholerae]HBK7271853.1 hypothetical protein [Vibrio cholerae]HBK7294001.1 hypothetical protein [Vibrio cholerae]HBK7297454.1 hypothetical protein [Vibrio cholerae]
MNSGKSLFSKVTPYMIGGALGLFFWSVMELFFATLKGADVKIIVAVISAFSALTTAVVLALLNHAKAKHREILIQEKIREREIEDAHRAKKVEIYNDFLKLVSSFFQGQNVENKKPMPKPQKVLDEFEKFQNGILLWGGPNVIIAFLNFRRVFEENPSDMFKAVDNLYKSLREDIGLSNKGLDHYETIQLYLSDPREIDTLIET